MNLLNISHVCYILFITYTCIYVMLCTLYLTGLYNSWLGLRVVNSDLGLYLNP